MQLWQIDIVGGVMIVDTASGELREAKVVTGVDDHSRFNVIAKVVERATGRVVCLALAEALIRFGVPEEILTDNGKQFTDRFGKGGEVLFDKICRKNGITHRLTAPASPTTTGKIERFHLTLRRELLDGHEPFTSLAHAQAAIEAFVAEYNSDRPHQALDGSVALVDRRLPRQTDSVITSRSASSAPAGYRFPREVIAVAVRWYLRYGLSYRDVEELLAERGIEVDHVTVYRWVQTFTSEFIDAARPARHAVGDRWRWTYLYRAIDQHGQVVDVLVCERRDAAAARVFFTRALKSGPSPVEVTTDRAPVYPRVIDDLVPAARHVFEKYANNSVEADHSRLKARLRPMRGMKTIRSLRVVAAGHAFVQNLRRGHYELKTELPTHDRLRVAFAELAVCL
jgi:IS6 family transposase